MLCCAVLCCAVLCCAVLCCAVLCCAVLRCAMLCQAVLCCAMQAYCEQLRRAAGGGRRRCSGICCGSEGHARHRQHLSTPCCLPCRYLPSHASSMQNTLAFCWVVFLANPKVMIAGGLVAPAVYWPAWLCKGLLHTLLPACLHTHHSRDPNADPPPPPPTSPPPPPPAQLNDASPPTHFPPEGPGHCPLHSPLCGACVTSLQCAQAVT